MCNVCRAICRVFAVALLHVCTTTCFCSIRFFHSLVCVPVNVHDIHWISPLSTMETEHCRAAHRLSLRLCVCMKFYVARFFFDTHRLTKKFINTSCGFNNYKNYFILWLVYSCSRNRWSILVKVWPHQARALLLSYSMTSYSSCS